MKIKRIICAVITILIIVIIPFFSDFSAEAIYGYPDYVEVTSEWVNVRSGPGFEYAKIYKAFKADLFKFVSEDGSWIKVMSDESHMFYIHKDYVKTFSSSGEELDITSISELEKIVTSKEEFVTGTITITGEWTRVRTGPGTEKENTEIGRVFYGEQYTCIGQKYSAANVLWYKIEYNGKEGYVISRYAKLSKNTSNTTSTNASTSVKEEQVSGTVTITGTYVNVRKDAGTSYQKIGEAYKGEIYTCIGIKEAPSGIKWFKIEYYGKVGYLTSSYAKHSKNISNVTSSNSATTSSTSTYKPGYYTSGGQYIYEFPAINSYKGIYIKKDDIMYVSKIDRYGWGYVPSLEGYIEVYRAKKSSANGENYSNTAQVQGAGGWAGSSLVALAKLEDKGFLLRSSGGESYKWELVEESGVIMLGNDPEYYSEGVLPTFYFESEEKEWGVPYISWKSLFDYY